MTWPCAACASREPRRHRRRPASLEALRDADSIVVCPSNPVVSIGPVLAVPGVREALVARRSRSWRSRRLWPAPLSRVRPTASWPSWEPSRPWSGWPGCTRRWVGTLVVDVADAHHAGSRGGRGTPVRGHAHGHGLTPTSRGARSDGGRCRGLRACRCSPSPVWARWRPAPTWLRSSPAPSHRPTPTGPSSRRVTWWWSPRRSCRRRRADWSSSTTAIRRPSSPWCGRSRCGSCASAVTS